MTSTETYRALQERARDVRVSAATDRQRHGTLSPRKIRIHPIDLTSLHGLEARLVSEDTVFASRVIEGIYAKDLGPLAENLGVTAIHIDPDAPLLSSR